MVVYVLLLGAELVGVSALALTAVGSTGREARVAFAAVKRLRMLALNRWNVSSRSVSLRNCSKIGVHDAGGETYQICLSQLNLDASCKSVSIESSKSVYRDGVDGFRKGCRGVAVCFIGGRERGDEPPSTMAQSSGAKIRSVRWIYMFIYPRPTYLE